MDNQGLDQNLSSRAKRKLAALQRNSTPSPAGSSSDFATPDQFGQSLLDMVRPKERWFPVVSDNMLLTDFLLEISCQINDEDLICLEGIDTDVLIQFYKDCDKITLFRTEMASMDVNPKVASKLFVAMGKYAASKNTTEPPL